MVTAAAVALSVLGLASSSVRASPLIDDQLSKRADPCAAIGGQKWVAPSAVRACFQSIPVNQTIKANVSFLILRYFEDSELRLQYV